MSEANKKVIGGTHYKSEGYETWDYIIAHDLNYLAGNVIKYVTRYEKKGNPLQDLNKAKHYLEKLIEQEQKIEDEMKEPMPMGEVPQFPAIPVIPTGGRDCCPDRGIMVGDWVEVVGTMSSFTGQRGIVAERAASGFRVLLGGYLPSLKSANNGPVYFFTHELKRI